MEQPVRLADTVWKLYEKGAPSHRLLHSCPLEDLYIWNVYEVGATLIGAEVRKNPTLKQLPISASAMRGLHYFTELYPEWIAGKPYMSLKPNIRRARTEMLFGDSPLALEPLLQEIPPNIYTLLAQEKLRGGMPLVRGMNADLLLVKLPHSFPNSVLADLLVGLLHFWRKTVPAGSVLRLSGRGSRSSRLRHELEMLGRFRLFAANKFDIHRTLQAACGDARFDRSDDFYRARTYFKKLLVRRWELVEAACRLLGTPLH
jgi:hypothetical protein